MKKTILILMMTIAMAQFAMGSVRVVMDPDYDKTTETLYFQFRYTTPYGVPKLDEKGNVMKDEKGSPIVEFDLKTLREHVVMRLQVKNGVSSCSIAYLTGRLDQDGKEEIQWKSVKLYSFVKIPMVDGSSLIFICFDYTFTDRGIGVSPATCKVWGEAGVRKDAATGKDSFYGYQSTRTNKNSGRVIMSGGSVKFGGYSDYDDENAWTNVEDVTFVESCKRLPIWGTGTYSNYGTGPMTSANIRDILHKNIVKTK